MCSARKKDNNGGELTLLADTGHYRGGIWFLDVTSPDRHLKPGVQEASAHLLLDGKLVTTGKVLAIGDWTDDKTTRAYVRFEFPAIDTYVEAIKAARKIEVQADGLSPLKLEPLLPIITAIQKCQHEGLNREFWKNAENVCS